MNSKGKWKKGLKAALGILLTIVITVVTVLIVHKDPSVPTSVTVKDGLSSYELAVENGYEGTVQEWLSSLSGKSAFTIAAENGYTGTEAEWAAALNRLASSDIVGIKTASFNSNGELIITLSDNTVINLGKATGVDGVKGKDGANGKDGTNGKDGANGADGIGISDVDINDDGELVISLSDNRAFNLGKVVGTSGLNGLSAFEIATITGKTQAATEEEWIDSLKGATGATGPQGPQGTDGDTPYIGSNGHWWIGETDTEIAAQGPQGASGSDGMNGKDGLTPHIDTNGNWWIGTEDTHIRAIGKSAFEVAQDNGVTMSVEEWLESLKGKSGQDGRSAYTIALEAGLVDASTTPEEWVASLKGADAIAPKVQINADTNMWEISTDNGESWTSTGVKATGADGAASAQGERGEQGIRGEQGLQGIQGEQGLQGIQGEQGLQGIQGERGEAGISPKVQINTDNEWEISLDDGKTWQSTSVKATGDRGESAYAIAKRLNPAITLSEAEWLESLRGKDAIAPKVQINGATNMWEISTDGGETWITTGVNATGAQGAQGERGEQGIRGEQGLQGIQGERGEAGISPKVQINPTTNEWEISTDNGATWAATGVKATGAQGERGEQGLQGVQGERGEKGDTIQSIDLVDGTMIITLTDNETVFTIKNICADGITPQLRINAETKEWEVSYDSGDSWESLGVVAVGKDGATGSDGATPEITISESGNWVINGTETDHKAIGQDGTPGVNGVTPKLKIENDYWYVSYDGGESYEPLNVKATGDDGATPIIGDDGYWYINGEKTENKALGADGVGITGVEVDDDGKLTITFSDGKTTTLDKSITGAQGIGIQDVTLTEDFKLQITLDNGQTTTLGPIRGEAGPQGIQGIQGVGISTVALNENYELVLTMTDNNIITVTGSLRGETGVGVEDVKIENNVLKIKYTDKEEYTELGNVKGDAGPQGAVGPKGPKGDTGAPGKDGRGILKTEVKDGHLYITYTDEPEKPYDVGVVGGNYSDYWEILKLSFLYNDDGTLRVSPSDYGRITEHIVVPSTFEGIPITYIKNNAFQYMAHLKSIILPSTLITMESAIFTHSTALEYADLSSTKITEIPSSCFSYCESFTTVKWPAGLETIDTSAFSGCNISDIVLPETLEEIGGSAFNKNPLTSITIPANVTKIGAKGSPAFKDCDNLTEAYFTVTEGWYYNGSSTPLSEEIVKNPTEMATRLKNGYLTRK